MNSAAGTPLSDTSPTTNQTAPSSCWKARGNRRRPPSPAAACLQASSGVAGVELAVAGSIDQLDVARDVQFALQLLLLRVA